MADKISWNTTKYGILGIKITLCHSFMNLGLCDDVSYVTPVSETIKSLDIT